MVITGAHTLTMTADVRCQHKATQSTPHQTQAHKACRHHSCKSRMHTLVSTPCSTISASCLMQHSFDSLFVDLHVKCPDHYIHFSPRSNFAPYFTLICPYPVIPFTQILPSIATPSQSCPSLYLTLLYQPVITQTTQFLRV